MKNIKKIGVIILSQVKRLDYLDITKAIAIICVVAGHADVKGHVLVSYFQLPLFFFISGYFFNRNISFKNLCIKKLKGLYVPFLMFELIFIFMHNILLKMNFIENEYFYEDYIRNIIHVIFFDTTEILLAPLWFLYKLH